MLDPPVTAAFGAVREAACGARQSDTDVIQSGVGEALNLSPVGGPVSVPGFPNDPTIDLIVGFLSLTLRLRPAGERRRSRIAIPSSAIEPMPARICRGRARDGGSVHDHPETFRLSRPRGF